MACERREEEHNNTTNHRLLTGWKLPADKLRQRFSLPAVRMLAVRTVERLLRAPQAQGALTQA